MAARNFGRVNVSISASTGGLTRGLGNASKQMRGFKAQTTTLTSTLQNSVAGFVGLGRGATVAAIGVRALGMAIKSLLGPLIVLTSLVGIFRAIGQAAKSLDETAKLARRLGMSASSIQAFSTVASEAGVSGERLNVMLTFMSRQLGQLAQGNAQAVKAFGMLGLTMADLQGLSPEEQFTLISQRIQALPNQSQRAAVAMMLFGRSGAEGLNFIAAAAGGAVTEMTKLQDQLGVSMTDQQVAGIEMMNDALARTSMVFEGFINQFLAGLAPAVATAANLFVQFFAENEKGFSIAAALANALSYAIRGVVGRLTRLYGILQIASAGFAKLGELGMSAFGLLLTGLSYVQEGIAVLLDAIGSIGKFLVDMIMVPVKRIMSTLAGIAEALGATGIAADLRLGVRVADGLTEGWESFGDTVRGSTFLEDAASNAFSEAQVFGTAASELAASGMENFMNPFAAFDAEFANVTQKMQEAGASAGAEAGGEIAKAIGASSKDLKAIVAGTSAGEAFRNSILRGADPRLQGEQEAERTADATERTADAVEEMAAAQSGGLGLASISV